MRRSFKTPSHHFSIATFEVVGFLWTRIKKCFALQVGIVHICSFLVMVLGWWSSKAVVVLRFEMAALVMVRKL